MKRLRHLPVAIALLLACGDENPPQSPTNRGSVFPPEDPGHFFVAFQQGLQTETAVLYGRHISDDFVFSPTPEDSLLDGFAGTGVFDGWTRPVEISALTPLFNDAKTISVEFTPTVEIHHTVFVRYRVAYELDVTDAAGDSREYRGVARFDFRNETGTWRLVRWDEIENVSGYASWGFLRGTLRPRLSNAGKSRRRSP